MPNDLILSNTRALILPGEMTVDRALEIINKVHARREMKPDDVYVFRMVLSNQTIDSYGTRMGQSSLTNYSQDFTEGRGVMNSHRTGGWTGQAELPLGRTFAADLNGQFLSDDAGYEATGGASLGVYSYIKRGLRLTDVSSDDAIEGIESGTINDVSVGFMLGDGGMYRCSICGENMMSWRSDCDHMPGVQYDEGRAFAWVDGARGREASLVYLHSTPRAIVDKAIRLVGGGKLSKGDALMLEERLGERIIDAKSELVDGLGNKAESAGKKAEQRGETGKVETKPEPLPGLQDKQTDEKGVTARMEWENIISGVRKFNPGLADRLAGMDETARPDAMLIAMIEQQSRIDALTPRAVLGDKYLDDLVDTAVKTRVRAQGSEFDAEKYKTVLRGTNDPDYIKAEIAAYERTVKDVYGDGKRPSGAKGVQGEEKPKNPVPYTVYKS